MLKKRVDDALSPYFQAPADVLAALRDANGLFTSSVALAVALGFVCWVPGDLDAIVAGDGFERFCGHLQECEADFARTTSSSCCISRECCYIITGPGRY